MPRILSHYYYGMRETEDSAIPKPALRYVVATRSIWATCVVVVALVAAPQMQDGDQPATSWPQWRGPLATGVAPGADPPTAWSETRNVRWKVPIPGHGSASPIAWDDRVFVLTAAPVGEGTPTRDGFFTRLRRRFTGAVGAGSVLRFAILAIDRDDGRVVWERTAVTEQPHEGRHGTGSWSAPSAVTDGEVVCAFFGSRGLYCYDMNGTLLWDRDFGDMTIRLGFGEGASPALYGDVIIVVWDHQGQSFIAALDKTTGAERWRTDREEETSWTTPLVVEHAGGAQVVTSATDRVRSYDVETGRLVWEGEGVTLNAIPTPVAADGVVYLMSGYRGNQLYAVDLDRARGDITGGDAVRWSLDRDTPYVPSPVLHDGILYFTKSNAGVLSAYDAESGRRLYGPERLPGIRDLYASPVAAGGRLYITSRDGATLVIEAGAEFRVLATNTLDDGFDASPAVVDGEIYLRGQRHLYCIAAN